MQDTDKWIIDFEIEFERDDAALYEATFEVFSRRSSHYLIFFASALASGNKMVAARAGRAHSYVSAAPAFKFLV